MAISYPLATMPSGNFRNYGLSMQLSNAVEESPFTYAQQVQSNAGERWNLQVELPPQRRATAAAWVAWLASLRGQVGTFEAAPDRVALVPRGNPTGLPVVNGAHAARVRVLSVKAMTASSVGNLLPGDYIHLQGATYKRLHLVLESLDANGSGIGSVTVWPALREALVDGQAIQYSAARGTFRLASNVNGWDVEKVRLYGIAFDAVEAV